MTRLMCILTALLAVPAMADSPRVATDISPVHSLVARVMQGIGTPDLILPPGASPHSYSMRASEASALERADLMFWIGPELTPWLERPVANLATNAKVLSLLRTNGTILHEPRGNRHGGTIDPHAWLDPENARVWVAAIASALAEVDSGNAAAYLANAESSVAELMDLQTMITAELAGGQAAEFAVYHDNSQYFDRRFELKPAFAIASTHATDPGPGRIAELRKLAQKTEVTCILSEPSEDTALIETVFESLDVKHTTIDLLGGEFAPGPQLYMEMMQALAGTYRSCLE